MKKIFYTILAASALFLGACKKDDDNNGGNDTYQPFTAGSQWKYRNEFTLGSNSEVDTTTTVMAAATKTINNKVYHLLTSGSGNDIDSTYIGFNNNVYSTIMFDEATGTDLDLPYFDAAKAAGQSWTSAFSFEEEGQQVQGQLKTTLIEKGITKAVLGKNYNGVAHSKIETQVKTNNQFITVATMDFYVAKNVGVIAMYTSIPNVTTAKSELISYTIK